MRDRHSYHPKKVRQIAEAYCMGTLPPSEGTAFEDHYITCGRCAGILEDIELYVQAMRAAAWELRRTAGEASIAVY